MGYSPWGHKESDMTERLSNGLLSSEAGPSLLLTGVPDSSPSAY